MRRMARPHVKAPGQLLVRGHITDRKQLRARGQAPSAHVLGIAGQLERLCHLGHRGEGAPALHAQEPPFDRELSQCLTDGGPAGGELHRQGALGQQRLARGELGEHFGDVAFDHVVLRELPAQLVVVGPCSNRQGTRLGHLHRHSSRRSSLAGSAPSP